MPRGSKQAYTAKQKRQARHIEEGYEEQGVRRDEAERRAWATVNKISGGGKKSGSGRGKKANKAPMKRGAARAAATRSAGPSKRATARRASPRRAAPRASPRQP